MTLQYIQSIFKTNVWNVKVKIAVKLSKIIFLSAKSHMHIFNMPVISVQSFKLNTWKLWEELITQSCSISNCLSRKCCNFVKNNFCISTVTCTFSVCFLHCAKFQTACLKTLGGVDYTNFLPHIKAKPQNCPSRQCCNFGNFFSSQKKAHANLQYTNNISVKFQIHCLNILQGVDHINLLPHIEA